MQSLFGDQIGSGLSVGAFKEYVKSNVEFAQNLDRKDKEDEFHLPQKNQNCEVLFFEENAKKEAKIMENFCSLDPSVQGQSIDEKKKRMFAIAGKPITQKYCLYWKGRREKAIEIISRHHGSNKAVQTYTRIIKKLNPKFRNPHCNQQSMRSMFIPPIQKQDRPIFLEMNQLFMLDCKVDEPKNKEYYQYLLEWLRNQQEKEL